MTIDLTTLLMYLILPVVLTLVTYIARNLLGRLEAVEEKMSHATTEPQVRQLISDRYDPLAQDIREIKENQQKLFELVMQVINKSN
jgi:hypothetical protein